MGAVKDEQAPSGERGSRLTRAQAVVALVGGLIAAAVGAFTLIDRASPKAPPPPAWIDARIVAVRERDEGETLREYVEEIGVSASRYTSRQLDAQGRVYVVVIRIRGQMGRRMPLRYVLHEVGRGPVAGVAYSQLGAVFVPKAQTHEHPWPVWVPRPPYAGRFYVRFTLQGPDRRPLDTWDTDRFAYAPEGRGT